MKKAYDDVTGANDSSYDREFLFLFTEMDLSIHQLVEQGNTAWVDTTERSPVYWFMNGRAAPDTLEVDNINWLPNQPYSCLPLMQAGEKTLLRIIGAGQDPHPLHPHGNHVRIIARDGRLLESEPGVSGPDLTPMVYTINSAPGETVDAIFEWTGKDLGWDIYGTDALGAEFVHTCTDADLDGYADDVGSTYPNEWCPDHGKPIPVDLPEGLSTSFGGFWSGSPYLGHLGSLPPGEGGLNPWGGYTYPWHSHSEKELLNNDLFPGGALTFVFIVPPGTPGF